MTRNAYPPTFRAPWLPSRAERLAAFRVEQERYNPRPVNRWRANDPEWRTLRALHLRGEPMCRRCAQLGRETAAAMVDHIQPVSIAPERRLDPTNLQSLCWPHHNEKTQRERRRA
jgi:5-methylcytosine-specific restriction endonuclease McrA